MPIIDPYWEIEQKKLSDRISSEGASNFLQWDFIRHDMFHECCPEVLERLQKSKYWTIFKDAVKEDTFGNPTRYYLYPESSGNLLWHAHSLLQLYNFFENFNIPNIKTIFEFGGGMVVFAD